MGLVWNSIDFTLCIPERRIDDLKSSLECLLKLMPKVTARQLAKVTGKIISLSPVFGNVCRIMTRYCYMKIVSRSSWDSVLNAEKMEHVLKEVNFWLLNIFVSNKKKLCTVFFGAYAGIFFHRCARFGLSPISAYRSPKVKKSDSKIPNPLLLSIIYYERLFFFHPFKLLFDSCLVDNFR